MRVGFPCQEGALWSYVHVCTYIADFEFCGIPLERTVRNERLNLGITMLPGLRTYVWVKRRNNFGLRLKKTISKQENPQVEDYASLQSCLVGV